MVGVVIWIGINAVSRLEKMKPVNETEKVLFPLLDAKGIASVWTQRVSPREDLVAECNILASDPKFRVALSSYLNSNPVILQSLETVLAQLAFSAGVHWQQTTEILQPLARRGWHLSRWLPTFLLIDGPLGRLLRERSSPLAEKLKANSSKFPLLANARDAFNNDLFRRVRNGFAHWSFTWYDHGSSAQIKIISWESGKEEVELSLLEAEALHLLSASVIQVLDQQLLRQVEPVSG